MVPPGVVTEMSTVPGDPGGATAVMVVAVTWVMVPGVEPKSTTVVPDKPDPVMVKLAPPVVDVVGGLTLVITGGPAGGLMVNVWEKPAVGPPDALTV